MGAIEQLAEEARRDFPEGEYMRKVADNALAELASLRQREKRLREMLKRLEQTGYLASGHCPICENYLVLGPHRPDCELAALLKED